MRFWSIVAAVLCVASLVGCASGPGTALVEARDASGQPVYGVPRMVTPATVTIDELKSLGFPDQQIRSLVDNRAPALTDPGFRDRHEQLLKICDQRAKRLNILLGTSQAMKVGIGTIGIIAGSIVVPALAAKASAAKSAIAAWGGVSGAANAAQLSFDDSGLAPLDRVRESEAFVSELKKLQANVGDLKANTGPAEQYLVQLRTVCTYSGPPKDNFGPGNGPGQGGSGGGAANGDGSGS